MRGLRKKLLAFCGAAVLLLACVCPARLTIVEVSASGRHRASAEFGSCSDVIEAKVVKDRAAVEMPDYIPHPELLSRGELRRRRRTKEVYTRHSGKLSRRSVTR